jgi:hypothetical protein
MATAADRDKLIAESGRLIEASRRFIDAARGHVASTAQRIERARNLLQVVWLQRELRRRGNSRAKRAG